MVGLWLTSVFLVVTHFPLLLPTALIALSFKHVNICQPWRFSDIILTSVFFFLLVVTAVPQCFHKNVGRKGVLCVANCGI